MTDVGKEDAQVSPEAEPELADATEEAPATVATGPRKRKQVDFFAPDDVKSPEKLVIKEVRKQVMGVARTLTQRLSLRCIHRDRESGALDGYKLKAFRDDISKPS
jgi:hypothetical protein